LQATIGRAPRKITTYRRLAEAVLEEIEALLGRRGKRWTENAALPGGDFPVDGFEAEVAALRGGFGFLAEPHARRLVRLYGTEARTILAGAARLSDLGQCFGGDLYEREVRHLAAKEWAIGAEDVLWRRTKCGLDLSAAEADALAAFMLTGARRRVAAE
jgi:glycerol-3-phosphate dehydrogenase